MNFNIKNNLLRNQKNNRKNTIFMKPKFEPIDLLFLAILVISLTLGIATSAQTPKTSLQWDGNNPAIKVTKDAKVKPAVAIRSTTQIESNDSDTIFTVLIQVTYFPFTEPEPEPPAKPDTIEIPFASLVDNIGPLDAGNNIGVKIEPGQLSFINQGDFWSYSNVDSYYSKIVIQYSFQPTATDRLLEVRINSNTGALIGSMPSKSTGSWTTYQTAVIPLQYPEGKNAFNNLYFVIPGTDPAKFWGNIKSIKLAK